MLKIVLKGDPIAQARVRVFRRGNRVMTYDPQGALKKTLRDLVTEQVEESK